MPSIAFTYIVHMHYRQSLDIKRTLGWCYDYAELMYTKYNEDGDDHVLVFKVTINDVTPEQMGHLRAIVAGDWRNEYSFVKDWLLRNNGAGVQLTAFLPNNTFKQEDIYAVMYNKTYMEELDGDVFKLTCENADVECILKWSASRVPAIKLEADRAMAEMCYQSWFGAQLVEYLDRVEYDNDREEFALHRLWAALKQTDRDALCNTVGAVFAGYLVPDALRIEVTKAIEYMNLHMLFGLFNDPRYDAQTVSKAGDKLREEINAFILKTCNKPGRTNLSPEE